MNDNTGTSTASEQTANPTPGASKSCACGAGCICGGKGPMASQMLRMMLPGEAGEHFRAAGIEFLKGFRELIDHRIETLSRAQGQGKGTKLNVE